MDSRSSVPSPRQAAEGSSSSFSSHSSPSTLFASHGRRPSLTLPPSISPKLSLPPPVPLRHGSFHGSPAGEGRLRNNHARASTETTPASRPVSSVTDDLEDDTWLDTPLQEILAQQGEACNAPIVKGDVGMEEAADVLLKNNLDCLLVQGDQKMAFFDASDLNTFLLLVLCASGAPSKEMDGMDGQSRELVFRLKRGIRFGVLDVCDVSQKNPYHELKSDTPLRQVLPLFSSGIHRVAVQTSPIKILTSSVLLEYLISLPANRAPSLLSLPIMSISLPLHPLVSLPGVASVLDAMQVLDMNGLSAIGVLSGSGGSKREPRARSSSKTLSASPRTFPRTSSSGDLDWMGAELIGVVSVRDCASLVVPSEGKQVLGLGLDQACRQVQVVEGAGQERGEERVPVHTVTHQTTLLRAAHLLFATASSRVFLRIDSSTSPPLSPAPSLATTLSSPPSSPSISSLSLSDSQGIKGLPAPPATQLSPHLVISIVDILACLGRSYLSKLHVDNVQNITPQSEDQTNFEFDPESIRRRRRASSSSSFNVVTKGFESWRWAGARYE